MIPKGVPNFFTNVKRQKRDGLSKVGTNTV